MRFWYRLLLIILFPTLIYSQKDNFTTDSGFSIDSTNWLHSDDEIRSYVYALIDNSNTTILGGNITSIFHEQVDSVWIIYKIENLLIDSVFSKDGLFRLPVSINNKINLIELNFRHPDYHTFDTSFIYSTSGPVILSINLYPKYKILLRGRVYAGNLPIEGVKVLIREKEAVYELETRGCFYDKENYWNCLYNGMFKQDLIIQNAADSIQLSFEREGMKPLSIGMVLRDYTGELLNIKMKYALKISDHLNNCFGLKMSFPFLTFNKNWFVDMTYYRTLNKKSLDRISLGIDANLLLSPVSESDTTFQNNTTTFDTSYISGYIGPSILFWFRKSDKRYFSAYAGLTAGIGIDDGDLFIQPFIGTRIFIDFNKAISVEFRHTPYDLDVVHYSFNAYGNAYRSKKTEKFKEYLLDIGIQIVF
jgi:hypothetical protein